MKQAKIGRSAVTGRFMKVVDALKDKTRTTIETLTGRKKKA